MAEMTILSVTATNGSNLSNLPIKNGQITFIQDKHKLAFDLDDKRVIYSEIIDLATEAGRTSLLAPVSGCYYFVVETAVLWTYRDGSWVQITTPPSATGSGSNVDCMIDDITGKCYKLHVVNGKLTMTETDNSTTGSSNNTDYMIDEVTGKYYKLHVVNGELTMTEVTA